MAGATLTWTVHGAVIPVAQGSYSSGGFDGAVVVLILVILLGIGAWLGIGFGTAHVARTKGRPYGLWFVIGLLAGVVGLIIAAALDPVQDGATPPSTAGRRQCPRCAEWIMAEAVVCRFCSSPVEPLPPPSPGTPSDDPCPSCERKVLIDPDGRCSYCKYQRVRNPR